MKGRTRQATKSVIVAVVVLGSALAGCALTAAEPDSSRVAATGRITDIDPNHGYAIVEFSPGNRMFVNMDKRELGQFIVGDEIRVDTFGRPLPPLPRSPRPQR
jgi:hypothetical protein